MRARPPTIVHVVRHQARGVYYLTAVSLLLLFGEERRRIVKVESRSCQSVCLMPGSNDFYMFRENLEYLKVVFFLYYRWLPAEETVIFVISILEFSLLHQTSLPEVRRIVVI